MTEVPKMSQKLAMEFFGTAILLCTIQGTLTTNPTTTPLAVVGILLGIIYMGCDISGAHYNPAVTLVFWLRGLIDTWDGLLFVPAQFGGGILGFYVARAVAGQQDVHLSFDPKYGLSGALSAELLFTTLLCFAILTVGTYECPPSNPLFGVSIVGVIYAGILCVGPVSGAAFNPVVAIVLALGGNASNMAYAFIVSAVNMAAPLVATAIFWTVAPDHMAAVWRKERVVVDEETPLVRHY